MNEKQLRLPLNIFKNIFIYIFALCWLAPVIMTVVTSIRTNSDILERGFWSIPNFVTLSNFFTAWQDGGMGRFMLNSFIITIPSVIITLFLASLGSYSLTRFKFPGAKLILIIFISGMMLPSQIILLPVFRLANFLHIYDTYLVLILHHIAAPLGFCIFVTSNYMRTVPREIFEQARIDGCGEFRIYRQIMIPLILPAIGALSTLEFTWIYNDFLWALILLKSGKLMPVTTGLLMLQGEFIINWTVVTAGALIAAIPTLVVFLLLQRYFISGLTMGAVKG